jgi:hypothetical protein
LSGCYVERRVSAQGRSEPMVAGSGSAICSH